MAAALVSQSALSDLTGPPLGGEAHGTRGAVIRRGVGGPGGAAADAAHLAELPVGLAVALRLHDAGHADDVIAVALGIPVQSVPVTLRVARGKLAQLLTADGA